MKKIFFLFCFAPLFLAAQSWKFTPGAPKPGDLVRVEFDLSNHSLKGVENLQILALEHTGDKAQAIEVAVARSGNNLSGWFALSSNAKSVMLYIENEDNRDQNDNNGAEGYFIPVCDGAGNQLPESMAAQAVLYRDWGGVFSLNRTVSKAFDLMSKALAAQPDLKRKYWAGYINYLIAVKKGDDGKNEALALLAEIEGLANVEEQDLLNVARSYDKLGQAEKAKMVREKIRSTWPKGLLVRQEKRKTIEMEPDLTKAESMIGMFVNEFPSSSKDDEAMVSQMRSNLANKYGDQQNWAKLRSVAVLMSETDRAGLYNNFAWELAEKGEALDEAAIMAATATDIAKREITQPTGTKPPSMTNKAWLQQRKQYYAMYADTYAFVLDKKGDSRGAATLQAEVIDINKGADPEMNERYTGYLERCSAPELRHELEGFLLEGKSTGAMKEQFKRLYMAEDRSATAAGLYIEKLESMAKAEKQKELIKEMINDPAPAFSLKNLKGETVSLEGLRGKVVVVDFWATWCGPCKASFPGMQKAVEFYKNDPNVAFVFVDSWEKAEDKLKNAADFISGKGYSFNVLIDSDDKVIGSYGVSGIPTKFVLDRNGRIRFKAIGFEGSDDGLLDEMKVMIEAARSQP